MADIDTLVIGSESYTLVPKYLDNQTQITTVDGINSFHSATGVQYATWNSADIQTLLGGGVNSNGVVLSLPWTSASYGAQIFLDDDPNPYLKFRQRSNGTWSTVYDVLTSGNYTNWVPTKTGSGASGTWGISISGNAATSTSTTNDSAGNNINSTYLKLSGGTLTGDLVLNTPYRDNYYASNLCRHFYTGTPTEFVIKTKIKYVSGTHMPIIRIYGYAYGEQSPIEIRLGFYIYDDTLGWAGAVSTGAWKPQIFLYKYTENSTNYVAVGFKGACYFCGFQVDAQIGASGSFGTNFSIDGWTTTHNGADTSVSLIPAVGTDNCVEVSYKTMKTDISGNASYATSAGSATSATSATNATNATYATKDASGNTITSTYLPFSGGTMTGSLSIGGNQLAIGDGAGRLLWRTNSTWASGVYYSTPSEEATVFAQNSQGNQDNAYQTQWLFAYTNPASCTAWTSLSDSTAVQIKGHRMAINKMVGGSTQIPYNLDVNGTANATTIYQNGTQVQNKNSVSGTTLIIP